MMTVQRSLQQTSTSSFQAIRLPASVARPHVPARRSVQVQAVQSDLVASAANLAAVTISSAFWTAAVGGAFGALSALTKPGEKKPQAVLGEAAFNASGSMRVGALMGLASGTLQNIGLEGPTASMGGIALGLGLYAALVAASNQPK